MVSFVLYGAFRYLFLVHRRERCSPTEANLTDPPLVLTVLLWLGCNTWVVYPPL